VKTTVDRADEAWGGNVGVVTLLLDRLALSSAADTLLMTCGPEVMMWYTVQSALGRGLKAESIFVSLERNMNCAIGLCGHCQFGPEFLCKDGPVFQYDRVASILRMDDL
jgi:NAD(P)H-flavin reductase